MKRSTLNWIHITALIIVLSFLSVIVFTLPALVKILDLSDNANIGSAIGGLTAPIIGIFSSVLLYLALSRQTESNANQRLRNESDVVFLLLSQLDQEYNSFFSKRNEKGQIVVRQGMDAINHFAHECTEMIDFKKNNVTFDEFYESTQILLLIRSVKLIERRISLIDQEEELRKLFRDKVQTFLECKMLFALVLVSKAIKDHNLSDPISSEIQQFIADHHSLFDKERGWSKRMID